MKLEAVIFDMDGTLVDSEPIWMESDTQFVESLGGTWDGPQKAEAIGMGSRNFVVLIKERLGLKQSVDELLALKNRFYIEASRGRIRAFPEMVKLVKGFAVEKMPLAVASASSLDIIRSTLDEAGLTPYFGDHLYSTDQVERSKPFPDVFLHAARQLRVLPHDVLVFEDSQHGVQAALAAKMKVCAVPAVVTDQGRPVLEKAHLLFRKGMAEFSAEKVLDWIDLTYCQCEDCTLYELGRCQD